jgi:hypothetical protein
MSADGRTYTSTGCGVAAATASTASTASNKLTVQAYHRHNTNHSLGYRVRINC